MTGTWLRGLLRRRRGALIATASGIAVAVALLASLGAFLAASKATMTTRAASGVVVDWQVQAATGVDPAAVLAATRRADGVTAALPVQFATTDGFTATTGGTQQSTGAGVVLGLPADYRTVFPGEIRTLSGSPDGVLVAQQTASNLHVAPGDKVDISVDALGGRTFHGKVASISAGTGARFSMMPPDNATGNFVKVVQRVPVKIVLDEGQDVTQLHAGLSVEVKVHLEH